MEKLFFIDNLKDLAIQLPIIIVAIIGIILAIARWRRHSTVSLITLIALFLLMAHTLFFSLVFAFLSYVLPSMGGDPESSRLFFQITSFLAILIDAIILTLLLVAALIKRDGQSSILEGQ